MKLEYKKALIDGSHIAYQTLDKLVKEAKDKAVSYTHLTLPTKA